MQTSFDCDYFYGCSFGKKDPVPVESANVVSTVVGFSGIVSSVGL